MPPLAIAVVTMFSFTHLRMGGPPVESLGARR